jgi:8-oxo-dGTP pyrophosphatase MutT (NUDIX family)
MSSSQRQQGSCSTVILKRGKIHHIGTPPTMSAARARFRRSVFVALLKGGEVLAVVEHNGQVGLPGGRVEPSESWIGALSREFLEEVKARLPFKRFSHCGWGTPFYEIRIFVAHVTDEEAHAIFLQSEAAGKLTDIRSWAWVPRAALPGLKLRPHISAALAQLDALSMSPIGRESEWTLTRYKQASDAAPKSPEPGGESHTEGKKGEAPNSNQKP